jgi:pyruvate dehydrogenase E1 component alpha subunit/2-oxoisovalerate dehydrogenase E1 component alpha subunit
VHGQEATPPIAAAPVIELNDWVFQALRESVMMLVRGFPLLDVPSRKSTATQATS